MNSLLQKKTDLTYFFIIKSSSTTKCRSGWKTQQWGPWSHAEKRLLPYLEV